MASALVTGTLATMVAILGFLSLGLFAICEKRGGKAGVLGLGLFGFDYLLLMVVVVLVTT